MTRSNLPRLLIAVNALLALALTFMWIQRDGTLRNTHWVAPAPHITDFAAMLPALPPVAQPDTSQFIAMLDRPLFSPTRRPPPPTPAPSSAAQAEAPVDNLGSATISGLYSGNGAGGIIIHIAGKPRRIQLNQTVEGWTLQSIQGRGVTFVRGAESRMLQLPKAALRTSAASPPGVGGSAMPSPARSSMPMNAPLAADVPPPAGGSSAPEAAAPSPPRATFGGRRR